jgi:hypothetical protein
MTTHTTGRSPAKAADCGPPPRKYGVGGQGRDWQSGDWLGAGRQSGDGVSVGYGIGRTGEGGI